MPANTATPSPEKLYQHLRLKLRKGELTAKGMREYLRLEKYLHAKKLIGTLTSSPKS